MADNDFFNKPTEMNPQDQNQTQTVALGDKVYTQEEAQNLIGLGEVALEFQDKWNRPVADMYPTLSEKANELAKAEERIAELEAQTQEQLASVTPPTDEEAQTKAVREAARKYGLPDEERAREIAREELARTQQENQARQWIDNAQTFLDKQKAEGKPTFRDVKEMADYMFQHTDDFESAYKARFHDELTDWTLKKMNEGKPSGMSTLSGMNVGNKEPVATPTTRENLGDHILEMIRRGQ